MNQKRDVNRVYNW